MNKNKYKTVRFHILIILSCSEEDRIISSDLRIDNHIDVQDLRYSKLRMKLEEEGQILNIKQEKRE